jgi:ankyrin repeat protein
MACGADSMQVVKFLVESGANINSRRVDGISPIYLAVIGISFFS